MKAIVQREYGGPEVLLIEEMPLPVINKNEVLIKVIATSVSSGDTIIRELKAKGLLKFMMRLMFGLRRPKNKVPGLVASGIINEIGSNVTNFEVGDEVYTITGMKGGCYAEYVKVNASKSIVHKPKDISFENVAPVPFGAMSALHLLDKVIVNNGDDVVIYGATGSVGSYAVQLAKNYGASVTAVCSTKNFEVIQKLGADSVIDYKLDDFTTNGIKYDVIFDAVGFLPKSKIKSSLNENGRYISIKSLTSESKEKLERLNIMIKEGKLTTLVDSIYSLEDISKAHAKVDSGRKVGNIIIKVS